MFNIGDKATAKLVSYDCWLEETGDTYTGEVTQINENGTVYIDGKYFIQIQNKKPLNNVQLAEEK